MADRYGRYDPKGTSKDKAFKPSAGFGKIPPEALGRLQRALLAGGVWLAFQIKKSINRGNRDGSDPSKPGEPPKKQTARLFKSITQGVETTPNALIVRVGTNVKYGRFLELGTSKMSPRPFLRPALQRHAAQFPEVVARAFRAGTGGASFSGDIESASFGTAKQARARGRKRAETAAANAGGIPKPPRTPKGGRSSRRGRTPRPA